MPHIYNKYKNCSKYKKKKIFFFEIEEEEGLEDNPGMSQKLTNCCMRACMDKIKSQRMQWNLLYKYINTKVVSC